MNINVGMVRDGGLAYDPSTDNKKPSGVDLYPHEIGKIGVIGNVFGGGNAAKVVGDTYVNIGTNEYEKLASITAGETDVRDYYILSGSTYKKVPEESGTSVLAEENTVYYELDGDEYKEVTNITVGVTDVKNYYTRTGSGTGNSPYVYHKTPVKAEANTNYYILVQGADIRGNIYGGGNAAVVTGDTNVQIGK